MSLTPTGLTHHRQSLSEAPPAVLTINDVDGPPMSRGCCVRPVAAGADEMHVNAPAVDGRLQFELRQELEGILAGEREKKSF